MSDLPEDALIPLPVLAGQLDLGAALHRVLAKGGMAGVDGISCRRLSAQEDSKLESARQLLAWRDYFPDPLRVAELPKKNGSTRLLLIPTVRDRVLQTAVAAWLGARWDRTFDDASFAYRPGLGVADALRRVRELQTQGFHWVLDADLRAFFDSIPHQPLFARARAALGPAANAAIWIERWTAAAVWDGESLGSLRKGVPQGSSLSPLLSNFYLDAFDRRMRSEGMQLVRYADDFLLFGRTPFELESAQECAAGVLNNLELEINTEKTRIVSANRGYRFLGARVNDEEILLPFAKCRSAKAPVFVAPPMGTPLLRAWRKRLIAPDPKWEWRAHSRPMAGEQKAIAKTWKPSGGFESATLASLRRSPR